MDQKELQLRELNEEIKAHDCLLRKTCKQVVPGEGSAHSQIMFIGEAPGKVEDDTGRPFVGPAGKFLDELLAGIGLVRRDVFITNMVKCRPPGNRDPLPEEIECCQPWLDKQIELIDPKVFVPLGRYAMAKFTPGLKISQAHGSAYKRGKKVFFIMYHPAVALYNGSMRKVLKEDIQKLKGVLDGKIKPESMDLEIDEIKSKLHNDEHKDIQTGMNLE